MVDCIVEAEYSFRVFEMRSSRVTPCRKKSASGTVLPYESVSALHDYSKFSYVRHVENSLGSDCRKDCEVTKIEFNVAHLNVKGDMAERTPECRASEARKLGHTWHPSQKSYQYKSLVSPPRCEIMPQDAQPTGGYS